MKPLRDTLVLRAAGGPTVGVGHLARTRALAQECTRRGLPFEFIVDEHSSAEWLRARGIAAVAVGDCPQWLDSPPRALWLDGFRGWEAELARVDRDLTCTILVENRIADRARASFNVYPALHYEADAWDRANPERVRAGSLWIPLSRETLDTPSAERDVDLLVSFGGADPAGLTERVLACLAELAFEGRVVTVVGPHMGERRDRIEAAGGSLVRHEMVDGGQGIARWQARSRFAVTALGTTLYELAWFGVPAMILANYEEDRPALDWYARQGLHLPLGVATGMETGEVESALQLGWLELNRRAAVERMDLAGGSRRIVDLLMTEPAHA